MSLPTSLGWSSGYEVDMELWWVGPPIKGEHGDGEHEIPNEHHDRDITENHGIEVPVLKLLLVLLSQRHETNARVG